MGKIKQGILGGFSGKVGPVIGSSWKGKAYIKSAPLSYNDANSLPQQQQRAHFSIISRFISDINGFIRLGFNTMADNITTQNAAMRINLSNAISGDWPNYELSLKDAIVAYGTIDLPFSPTANADGEDITASWSDNSGLGNAEATDKVMLLLYNHAKRQSVYSLAVAERASRTATISAPAAWSGDQVAVYLAMQRPTTGDTSKSAHLGIFTI